MSVLKVRANQIGIDSTATNNFSLEVPTIPDGTIKLGRGNSNATTATIFSVSSSNNVTFGGNVSVAGLTTPSLTGLTTPIAVSGGGTGDTGTAWTSVSSTITASSGTFTTASGTVRYKTLGKTVFFNISVTVTTVGSASGVVFATLPFVAAASGACSGREIAVNGWALTGTLTASSASLAILNYANAFPAANGYILVLNGVAETT